NDPKFIAEWTEPIVKACEFIENACAQTNHDGVKGLLPPAVATDAGIPTQAVWNLAWNYKGLVTAVQFLKRIHNPRAAEFDALAKRYKKTFVKAYRRAAAAAPKWRDAEGHEYPLPPTTLSTTPMPYSVDSYAFYLDTGPMVLVWAGLMQADDPLMQAAVKFFREGPDWALKGPRFNPICRPVLIREISSCEPCYSWNVFYSWQLGDRQRFLEGMYSLFTADMSQQTFSGSEHRNGMCDVLGPNALAFDLARLSVIDDEIEPGKLHLLRLCPLAWVSSKDETRLLNMPTVYGPVTLRFKLSPNGKVLDVSFSGRWWQKPKQVILHVPPVPGLRKVEVNGVAYPAKGPILLPP
ncbi:MAG: hypothetical protein ACRED1_06190, partial [Limisphaerales bacterium]